MLIILQDDKKINIMLYVFRLSTHALQEMPTDLNTSMTSSGS